MATNLSSTHFAGARPSDWYDSNWENVFDHNHVNTREELLEYDPALYELIDELLPHDTQWPFCYAE